MEDSANGLTSTSSRLRSVPAATRVNRRDHPQTVPQSAPAVTPRTDEKKKPDHPLYPKPATLFAETCVVTDIRPTIG